MRNTTKTESRHCNLRDKDVLIMLEGIKEMGNPKILGWKVKKCIDKEKDCFRAGCSFCKIGGKNPFSF